MDSLILREMDSARAVAMVRILEEWLDGWQLDKVVFRAVRDEANPEGFHRACDELPRSLLLCKSGSAVFGGFATESWKVWRGKKKERKTFESPFFVLV